MKLMMERIGLDIKLEIVCLYPLSILFLHNLTLFLRETWTK